MTRPSKKRQAKRKQYAKRCRNRFAGHPPKGSGTIIRCRICTEGHRVGRTRRRVQEHLQYGHYLI